MAAAAARRTGASVAGSHLSRRLLDRHLRADVLAVGAHQRQSVLDEHLARRWRGERSARRMGSLVAAQGSGRAGWLVDNFQPTNTAPSKANATDEILVIPTTTPLSAADSAAISTYWQSVWLADGDAGKIAAANAALTAAVGAAHAADLISDYAPFNLTDSPAAPLDQGRASRFPSRSSCFLPIRRPRCSRGRRRRRFASFPTASSSWDSTKTQHEGPHANPGGGRRAGDPAALYRARSFG